eukprot:Platyproteum_vivax@DN6462_c0_g1_i1.p1
MMESPQPSLKSQVAAAEQILYGLDEMMHEIQTKAVKHRERVDNWGSAASETLEKQIAQMQDMIGQEVNKHQYVMKNMLSHAHTEGARLLDDVSQRQDQCSSAASQMQKFVGV